MKLVRILLTRVKSHVSIVTKSRDASTYEDKCYYSTPNNELLTSSTIYVHYFNRGLNKCTYNNDYYLFLYSCNYSLILQISSL